MDQVVQVRLSAISAMGMWTGEVYVHYQTADFQWRTKQLSRFRDEAAPDGSLIGEALHVLAVAAESVANSEDAST
jgi:hypothetical protein